MKYDVLGMAKTGKYSKFDGQKYKKCREDDIDLNEKASDFLTRMNSSMTKLAEATYEQFSFWWIFNIHVNLVTTASNFHSAFY